MSDEEKIDDNVVAFSGPSLRRRPRFRSGFAAFWRAAGLSGVVLEWANFEMISDEDPPRNFIYTVNINDMPKDNFPMTLEMARAKLEEVTHSQFQLLPADCWEVVLQHRRGEGDPFKILVASPSGAPMMIRR